MEIPYEKRFHFRDGSSVGSLEMLKAKIESLTYQEFYNHVNASKNDFASWIQHVLHEDRLAEDLHNVTSIVETVEIINDYLHPRPVTAMREDVQSRIESTLFPQSMPTDTTPAANQMPKTPVTPAASPWTEEQIPEEKIPAAGTLMTDKVTDKVPGKIQQRFEHSLFSQPMPENNDEVERETVAPAPREFRIIEEPKIEGKVKEELFGRVPEVRPAPVANDTDATRMIVKDFMFGLLFGLVIGVILGHIIQF